MLIIKYIQYFKLRSFNHFKNCTNLFKNINIAKKTIFDKNMSNTISHLKSENYALFIDFYPLLEKFTINLLFKWGLV